MRQKLALVALALLAVTALVPTRAAEAKDNDAVAVSDAKIGMAQAVQAAEQQIGGKASKAEYERHKGQWVFDVEVVKGTEVSDVKVDATSGKVIASSVDKTDGDEDRDAED